MKNKKNIAIIILMLIFVVNTVLVICDSTSGLDNLVHSFFVLINCKVLDVINRALTEFGGSVVSIAVLSIAVITLFIKGYKKEAFYLGLTTLVAFTFYYVSNTIIARPRPEYLSYVPHGFSYPSGHTTTAVTLYGCMLYLAINSNLSDKLKNISKILFPVLILIVICTRLYLGVHFVTDIIGGLSLSLTVQLIAQNLYEQVKK